MINENWLQYYDLCKNYYMKNRNLCIPYTFVDSDVNLGLWISRQRKQYKLNKLSDEKIKKLNELNMIWDIGNFNWYQMFELAKEYYNLNHNLLIPSRYIIHGMDLGTWLGTQRKGYYSHGLHKLSIERQKLLEDIGMIWDVNLAIWMSYFDEAKCFFEKYNHLYVPVKYVSSNGLNVGKWLSSQRSLYRESIKKGKLSEMQDKVELLESIGMNWEVNKQKNTSFGEQTLFYYLSFCFKDIINRYSDLGFELDIYIPSLKLAIEYDGYIGHRNKEKDIKKQKKCKEHGIYLLNIRENKCPIVKGNVFNIDLNNLETLKWAIEYILKKIKEKYNMMFSLDIDILRDSHEIMDMYLKVCSYRWEKMYDLAVEYYNEHGDLLIPNHYETKGVKLGYWLYRQRQGYRLQNGNRLLKLQIERLEKIGMVWDVKKFYWDTNYNTVKDILSVSDIKYNLIVNDINIYSWWKGQLKRYYDKKLNKLQEKLIEELLNIDKVA